MKYFLLNPLRIATLLLSTGLAFGFISCSDDDAAENPAPINQQDYDFVSKAAMANIAEMEISEIAAVSAEDSLVRLFASAMVTHHDSLQKRLEVIAEQKRINLPTTMDPAHTLLLQQLNTLDSTAFDRFYMSNQIMDHQISVNDYQQEVNDGLNTDVKNYATTFLPLIKSHLQSAKLIDSLAHQ